MLRLVSKYSNKKLRSLWSQNGANGFKPKHTFFKNFFKKIYFTVRKLTFEKYSSAFHCHYYSVEFFLIRKFISL